MRPAQPAPCVVEAGRYLSDDVLSGTSGTELTLGKGGDDTIQGLGGNGVICGNGRARPDRWGRGSDSISGRRGSDTIMLGEAQTGVPLVEARQTTSTGDLGATASTEAAG